MTKLQAQCLEFLRTWFRTHVEAPTYDQIKQALGMTSKSRVSVLLDRLEEGGFITREKYRQQSLRLVPQSDDRVKGALDAARALLDAIVTEDPDSGIATVRSDALGALDVAMAELAA